MKFTEAYKPHLITVAAIVMCALLQIGSAVAVAAVTAVTPVPGPLPNGGAVLAGFDLQRLGYSAAEFFIDGNADSYHNVGDLTNDAEWTVAADGAAQPYKTRVQILKPSNPRSFNGTVYVEWFNVSAQADTSPDWGMMHVEMKRQGAIYVGISAQAVGVNNLKATLPARYGSLLHPGDSYSYDIYAQVGQALRDESATFFGPKFVVRQLIALGESQSAGRLVTFVNAFADGSVYDGYLIHSRGQSGAPLRQSPLALIAAPTATLITDLDKPVFTLQSETDSRIPRQEDSPHFRWWEVAGTSHIDTYSFAQIALIDYGDSPKAAQRMFDTMINVVTGPSTVGDCVLGVNAGPHVWVAQAALRHLKNWVVWGIAPPIAPRLDTADGTPTGALVLDEHGNATGGIRSPHLDVPIATLRGTGNTNAAPPPPPLPPTLNFCALFGTTTPFSDEKLAQLYRNHGSFTFQWIRSLHEGVRDGYFLPQDAVWLGVSAATSDIGKNRKHW